MFKIDKGIEPKNITSKKYPFAEMVVGDSFFVKRNPKKAKCLQISILAAAKRFKPRKFTTRKEVNGIRCWRIE